jgi:glycosyltransferase involved in cell wall biosynthesis
MTVAAFTGSHREPSSRFRIRQLMPALSALGVDVTDYPAPFGTFPPASSVARPFWGIATMASRIPQLVGARDARVTFLQREMLSTFHTLERFTATPRVFDVDDAIFLFRGGAFSDAIAKSSARVIAGNSFIADHFSRVHSDVVVIPTAVDTDRFVPGPRAGRPVIGWSGSSSGLSYLYAIEPQLKLVLDTIPGAVVRVVCDQPPAFGILPADKVEYVRWSPEAEVPAIQGMSVGLMPLDDTPWSRGKCAYKMLLYMSCGVPVAVSNVGMNIEVLAKGRVGLGVDAAQGWDDALIEMLRADADLPMMGDAARNIVVEQYSIHVVAPMVADALNGVAR